jgi:hypothetical protein
MKKKMALSLVDGTPPQPPRKLGATGLALWNDVQRQYRIGDIGGTETLAQICLAADRVQAIADSISRDGEVLQTPRGPKANPLLRDELQGRAFIVRALKVLGLTIEDVKPIGRPGRPLGITWEDV